MSAERWSSRGASRAARPSRASSTDGVGGAGGATPAGVPSSPEPPSSAAASPAPEGQLRGADLARAMLEAARSSQRASARRSDPSPRRRSGSGGYTAAGPDPRDPQPFKVLLAKLIRDRGWQRPAAEALVFGAWARVVGPDIAAHCRPVKLENGELTVEAESTTWATQLRLLSRQMLAKIAQEVGPKVVTQVRIHGPAAPSWSRGPRRVRGRGPGDTYG